VLVWCRWSGACRTRVLVSYKAMTGCIIEGSVSPKMLFFAGLMGLLEWRACLKISSSHLQFQVILGGLSTRICDRAGQECQRLAFSAMGLHLLSSQLFRQQDVLLKGCQGAESFPAACPWRGAWYPRAGGLLSRGAAFVVLSAKVPQSRSELYQLQNVGYLSYAQLTIQSQ